MSGATVLICDDNYTVHESLRAYLNAENISTVSVYDGETALEMIHNRNISLLVLDVMMPGISGIEVCKEIRKFNSIPIIVLSAKSSEEDRIEGLELGADDYVTKPFSPRELAIKIRRLLNRTYSQNETKKLILQELTVLPESLVAFVSGEKIPLTPKEVRLLAYLVANAGKAVSRGQILNSIWGYDNYCDTRVVDTLVKRIRQKLPTDGVHFALSTIYGVGYKLEEIL